MPNCIAASAETNMLKRSCGSVKRDGREQSIFRYGIEIYSSFTSDVASSSVSWLCASYAWKLWFGFGTGSSIRGEFPRRELCPKNSSLESDLELTTRIWCVERRSIWRSSLGHRNPLWCSRQPPKSARLALLPTVETHPSSDS